MGNQTRLPLSVVMVARNEAHRLRRSLGSVADLASEIVVVHNDCTDETERIAREEFEARTYEHPWHGQREQKQIALDYATQPWVLLLDADEELSTPLRKSLEEFIRRDDPTLAGAYVARKVWFLGRWITHGDWYPDETLRLIRRGRGKSGGNQLHDKIELDGKAQRLRGDLYHYTYEDLPNHVQKIPYFGGIFLELLREKGKRWSSLEVAFRACWRFFRCYVIRRGFLDGFPGFYIACFVGFSTLYRYSLLLEDRVGTKPNTR